MAKATSNETIKEHLCEMMERLLDDSLFEDPEKAKVEIERAKTLNSIVASTLDIQKIEVEKKRTVVEAMDVAGRWNYKIGEIKQMLDETRRLE